MIAGVVDEYHAGSVGAARRGVGVVGSSGGHGFEATLDDNLVGADVTEFNAGVHLTSHAINQGIDDEHAALPVRNGTVLDACIGVVHIDVAKTAGIANRVSLVVQWHENIVVVKTAHLSDGETVDVLREDESDGSSFAGKGRVQRPGVEETAAKELRLEAWDKCRIRSPRAVKSFGEAHVGD